MCFWRSLFVLGWCHQIVAFWHVPLLTCHFVGKMLATLVVVGQALLVPLALHGLAFGISKAVAWHAHRVLPLWWCPIFWCTWTLNVGYPGESGICAPCSTGITWANMATYIWSGSLTRAPCLASVVMPWFLAVFRTPNVGYPGESGTRAPCSPGIAWTNIVLLSYYYSTETYFKNS